MSRGILRGRVHGSIMERRLQIEVHGLLRTAAIHTETDLYHRWVYAGAFSSLNGKPRFATRNVWYVMCMAEINPIFALSDRRCKIGSWESSLCIRVGIARWTVCATNFARLGPGPNIDSISLKSRLRALCVYRGRVVLPDAFHKWSTREQSAAENFSLNCRPN